MKAKEFIEENYSGTALNLKKCTGFTFNDIAYICEDYHRYKSSSQERPVPEDTIIITDEQKSKLSKLGYLAWMRRNLGRPLTNEEHLKAQLK